MVSRLVKTVILAMFAVVMLASADHAAQAQGFSVRPMRVDASIPPAREARIPIEISNTSGRNAQVLELEIVDMLQQPNGQWQFVPAGSEIQAGLPASSRDWITLETGEIELDAGQTRTVHMTARLPSGGRGTYLAGLLVRSRPIGETGAALRIQLQFLVPVLLTVEGRPARQNIQLKDLSMQFVRPVDFRGEKRGKPTTMAYLHVDNEGQTYSRLTGNIQVDREQDGNWRKVTRMELDRRGIIPGARLELPFDLERALPAGIYRLTSQIKADGRRLPRLSREVVFDGDPDAVPGSGSQAIAFDAALVVEPPLLEMKIAPGATRTATLSLTNPGDQPLNVTMTTATPDTLEGVAMGDLNGDVLSASPWTRISPSEFIIQPDGRRNVRVVSRIPREGIDRANYYADVVINSSYQDGQSAGVLRSTVHLTNDSVGEQRDAVIEQVGVANVDDDKGFVIQSRFVNTGNVHVEPSLKAELLARDGSVAASIDLDGEEGRLLPLGVRDYSGSVDIDGISDGEYTLLVSGFIGTDQPVEKRAVLQVGPDRDNPGSGKSVRIVE